MSLGVDLITGAKTCSFNCIYCQLGRTANLISRPEDLRGYVRAKDVIEDLKSYSEKMDLGCVDVVTFSGNGEPTLNPELGLILIEAKRFLGRGIPFVLLTNSSMLKRNDVRRAVSKFDIVCVKLDAGDEKTFRLINRPAKDVSDLETIVDSIKKLKKELSGKLMVQSMFLSTTLGFANCRGFAFERLLERILSLDPDVIQVDTPFRPGGEEFVRHLSIKELKEIGERFYEYFPRDKVWIFGVHERGGYVRWKKGIDLGPIVIDLLRRRPCRIEDMVNVLGVGYEEISRLVRELLAKGVIERMGRGYYRIK